MLNDKNQIDKIARGIYNAFVEYKNKYDTGMTIPYKPLSDPLPETTQQSDTKRTTLTWQTQDRRNKTPRRTKRTSETKTVSLKATTVLPKAADKAAERKDQAS